MGYVFTLLDIFLYNMAEYQGNAPLPFPLPPSPSPLLPSFEYDKTLWGRGWDFNYEEEDSGFLLPVSQYKTVIKIISGNPRMQWQLALKCSWVYEVTDSLQVVCMYSNSYYNLLCSFVYIFISVYHRIQ